MPRIYARVKKEFGPDAVIVRTRSLLREGAEPLIEVLAGLPEGEAELAFDLQRVLIDGALDRAQSPGRAAASRLTCLPKRPRRRPPRWRPQAICSCDRTPRRVGSHHSPIFPSSQHPWPIGRRGRA